MNSVGHFILGDEVYLVDGNGEPFGMVIKVCNKNIHIKPHDTNVKSVSVKNPTKLYLGKEWSDFNSNGL